MVTVRRGSSSSVGQERSSLVRSSPAKASVIWVPMLAICTMGAMRKPRNRVKLKRSPRVSCSSMMSRPP
jgi:hypothetical protein